jgi:hypothetical protein
MAWINKLRIPHCYHHLQLEQLNHPELDHDIMRKKKLLQNVRLQLHQKLVRQLMT